MEPSVAASPDDPFLPASKQLLNQLRAEAGSQRLQSLDRLEQACDSLVRLRTIIDAAKVGRECNRLFKKGPDGQSIRNDAAGFRAYVALRREEQEQAPETGRRRTRGSSLADRIEAIEDPNTRAQLRMLLIENADLKRRFGDLTAALAEMVPGIDLDALVHQRRTGGPVRAPQQDGASAVNPSQVSALERVVKALTSEDVLRSHGLVYDGRRLHRAKPPYTPLLESGLLSGLIALHEGLMAASGKPALPSPGAAPRLQE